MVERSVCLFLLPLSFCFGAASSTRSCVGSMAVGSFRLSVQAPGQSLALPIGRLNNLPNGSTLQYQPLDLPADVKNSAKLTLVMVPMESDVNSQVTVLEPRAMSVSTTWTAPFRAGMIVLVYGPQGLDEKRVTNLVTKDQALISQLADYADQTAEVETTIDSLSSLEEETAAAASGTTRATPEQKAIFALMRAMTPAASSYSPLAGGRRVEAVTMRGRAADAFFENAGGIIPGGGILPTVKTWLLPDTEFRSVFAQPADPDGVTLCAQWQQAKSKNRLAYLWAHRFTNAAPPEISLPPEIHLAIGQTTSVPVTMKQQADLQLASHIFGWGLELTSGSFSGQIQVRPSMIDRSLEFDLHKFNGVAGQYKLAGHWDWTTLKASGDVYVHKLGDLKAAQIAGASLDRLVTGTGPVAVQVTGANARFVDRVGLSRKGFNRATPESLDFGVEASPTDDLLAIDVDTDSLRPGEYLLALARSDGATADLPLRILPANPVIANLPLRVNVGAANQTLVIEGSGLNRIEAISSEQADLQLGPVDAAGRRRELTVRLRPGVKQGDQLTLLAKVEGLRQPLQLAALMQVIAPKPQVKSVETSLPEGLTVQMKPGELPAGSFVEFAVKFEPSEARPTVRMQCAETARTIQPLKLDVGEKAQAGRLSAAGSGTLFLSLDVGAIGQAGCSLQAALETAAEGRSDSFTLGRVVHVPRIESVTLSNDRAGENGYIAMLKGQDLETIEKTGWDAQNGLSTPELPRPIAGEGAKQTLRIALPWPSPTPKAPLFIWLRGEKEGRATKVTP